MTGTSALAALLALVGVIGLILLARRAALLLPRWTVAAMRPGPLRLEAALALDPRRRLLLLRCGPRQVLLLTGGGQDLVVGWLDGADAAAGPPA